MEENRKEITTDQVIQLLETSQDFYIYKDWKQRNTYTIILINEHNQLNEEWEEENIYGEPYELSNFITHLDLSKEYKVWQINDYQITIQITPKLQ